MNIYIKKMTCFVVMLIYAVLCSSETISLSFSGVTTEGRRCLLDSVKIENLTNGWEQTLDCTQDSTIEIELTEKTEGIEDVAVSTTTERLLAVSQNYSGDAVLSVCPTRDGIVKLQVTDMFGRIVIEHIEYLYAGYHLYALHLNVPQLYIVSAFAPTESASVKVLGLSQSGGYNLNRVSSIMSAPNRLSRVAPQNTMRYTGYTNQKGEAIASTPVTQEQSSDEHIVLYFSPIIKSQEGMYVSMIGFNGQLYSYAFDKLTTANLSTHQQFVSNLNMANGTILYHAVYTALDNIVKAPVPRKLENVSLITFTDGLDIGSWRMNTDYPSEQLYLDAVNKQIHRTCIDGIDVDAYAIGVKGSDVSDTVRFESDLHQLASDSANVFNVSNMDEVNARFRDIAAKIYNSNTLYSLTINLPAPEPGSVIRFTFDNVSNAANSIYYIEGTYNYDFSLGQGILNDVTYCGLKCSNGTTWGSTPEGIFDKFIINELTTNLGERVSTTNLRQWTYIPSTSKWQINSEFDPSTNSTTQEERTSALVMLVLDCSSSLGTDFASVKTNAKEFLNVLAGQTTFYKPSVSSKEPILGKLSAICGGSITNDGGLTITEKGICISEYSNMDSVQYYSSTSDGLDFDVFVDGLIEGKTYYYCAYARNNVGISFSTNRQFTAIDYYAPTVTTTSASSNGYTTAIVSGEVVNDGGTTVFERGVCYSVNPNPTIADNKISEGSGVGTYTCNLTDLSAGTTYYVRAYATNSVGTTYGEEMIFSTLQASIPIVMIKGVTVITSTTAKCWSKVTDDGGLPITEIGCCYSTSPNPTIADSTISLASSGIRTDILTLWLLDGLTAGTTYYVRAYATNSLGTSYSEEIMFFTNPSGGVLPGEFSVSATKTVHFSMGNLQYQASTHTWRFAEQQYFYVGSDNDNISASYSGWIDLFGWGTGNNPTKTSTSESNYSSFTDWGINAISNGGNTANSWRTLTKDEWLYIFRNRTNADSLFGLGTVDGVNGVIILPDQWTLPNGITFNPSTKSGLNWQSSSYYNSQCNNYSHNTYTTSQWAIMEAAGAVFLPAAGFRGGAIAGIPVGSGVVCVGTWGFYWSSTPSVGSGAYYMRFTSSEFHPHDNFSRFVGLSVRLVR